MMVWWNAFGSRSGSLRVDTGGVEEFESKMDTIEEGIRAHPALNAFEMSLWRKKDRPPLPSAKYLALSRRHVRHGATKRPSVEEGSQIAGVLLAPFMHRALWETDWNRETLAQGQAASWLGSRDLAGLRHYILASERSLVAWDTLEAICQQLGASGEKDVPNELITWGFRAAYGARPRPAEGPAPRHRLRKVGYILRDNEIRHTVDLLTQVGMTKTAACQAVAKGTDPEPTTAGRRRAVENKTSLGPSTVIRICRKPYSTVFDLGEEAMKRLEPSYYVFWSGPGSDSSLSTSTPGLLGVETQVPGELADLPPHLPPPSP